MNKANELLESESCVNYELSKTVTICGAVIINKDSIVLVREAKKECFGKYNIPGGHVESGEDILAATIREVKEETNLDIKPDQLIGVYPQRRGDILLKMYIFLAYTELEQIEFKSDEILSAEFIPLKEFFNLSDDELRSTDLKRIVKDSLKGKQFRSVND